MDGRTLEFNFFKQSLEDVRKLYDLEEQKLLEKKEEKNCADESLIEQCKVDYIDETHIVFNSERTLTFIDEYQRINHL